MLTLLGFFHFEGNLGELITTFQTYSTYLQMLHKLGIVSKISLLI